MASGARDACRRSRSWKPGRHPRDDWLQSLQAAWDDDDDDDSGDDIMGESSQLSSILRIGLKGLTAHQGNEGCECNAWGEGGRGLLVKG